MVLLAQRTFAVTEPGCCCIVDTHVCDPIVSAVDRVTRVVRRERVDYRMLLLLLLLLAVLLLSSVPRPRPERNGKMVADGPVCPSPQSSAPLDLGSCSTRPYSTGYTKDPGCEDSLLRRTYSGLRTHTETKTGNYYRRGSAKKTCRVYQ